VVSRTTVRRGHRVRVQLSRPRAPGVSLRLRPRWRGIRSSPYRRPLTSWNSLSCGLVARTWSPRGRPTISSRLNVRLTSDYVFSGGGGKASATTAQSAPLRVSYARYASLTLSAGASESATCRICAGQRRGGELLECVPGVRSRVSPRPVLQSTVWRSGAARGAQRLGSGGPVAPVLSMRGASQPGAGWPSTWLP